MKTCSMCKQEKAWPEEFHQGQSACKPCNKARAIEHYHANKAHRRAGVEARMRRINAFIDAQKVDPCLDCGESYPPYVMDFDHRPDEVKLFAIAKARNVGYSLEKIRAEIAKCDLVCSNCHRERTFQRYSNRQGGLMIEGSV